MSPKGEIMPLDPERSDLIEISEGEKNALERVESDKRVAALLAMRQFHRKPTPKKLLPLNNSKRRALKKQAAKALKSFEAPRCLSRDKDGHRCNQKPHNRGNHKAFGREWS